MSVQSILDEMEELEDEIDDYKYAMSDMPSFARRMVMMEEIQIREEEMERLRRELNKAWLRGED